MGFSGPLHTETQLRGHSKTFEEEPEFYDDEPEVLARISRNQIRFQNRE